MNAAEIISRKRDGLALTAAEIEFMVAGFVDGRVERPQMAAWAMAVLLRDMNTDEIVALTQAMLYSGQRFQWPSGRPKVDKHSTGGIGDKISIPLAPLWGACGLDVPMISGRGLGATGGTIDKLESIGGYRTQLSMDEFREQVNSMGVVIAAASAEIAPADKELYALRDVTGTVPAVPLITASILSKKLAEGLDALILDVKWGNGAFMKTSADAKRLAESLVRVSATMGVPTKALVTNMNQPLGKMVGNCVEIEESESILRGAGPSDVRELTLRLAAEGLLLGGISPDLQSAITLATNKLDAGEAWEKYEAWIQYQGGDRKQIVSRAAESVWRADRSGYLSTIDTEQLGYAVIDLGGGRRQQGQAIDHGVGFEIEVRLGDRIESGQALARIFSRSGVDSIIKRLQAAFVISEQPPQLEPLVLEESGLFKLGTSADG